MKKSAAFATIALAGALAATGASAHDSYGYHSHQTGPVYAPSHSTTYGTTYTAPTVNLGPIEYVQPNSSVQYVQPATTTYSVPSYTPPRYSYVVPSHTALVYTQPAYSVPSYVQPRFDATARVKDRLDRQRSRIRNANDRGELRRGERKRLRQNMRSIRDLFRAYKAQDGVIDQNEFAVLRDRLNEQSQRIRRLANNRRVQGPLVSPYAHGYTRY